MSKNIATTVETEWENYSHLAVILNRNGYFMPIEETPEGTREILSPDKFSKTVVGHIRNKERTRGFETLKPVEIVLKYLLGSNEVWQYRKVNRLFEFRGFLEREKIPYTELPDRGSAVASLRRDAEAILKYASRLEGK